MADATTISGSVMFIEYSDTPGSAKKSAVCQSEGSFDGSRNVVSDETNCGTLKVLGPQNNRFTLNAVVDTVPDANEASFNDFQTLYANNTKKYWHLTDSAETIYHGGYGWISALGQQNVSGQTAKFTMTIEIEGDIDTEPAS
jgi:hypothetical protein